MDLDGTILEANRLSWEACGYTREQIVGKPFWEGPWWAPSPSTRGTDQGGVGSGRGGADVSRRDAVLRGRRQRADRRYHDPADQGRQRDECCFWPRPASTSPTASGPRPTGRSSSRSSRTAPTSSACATCRACPFFVNRAGLEMVGLDDIEQARRTPVASFFFPEDQPRIMRGVLSVGAGAGPRRDRGPLPALQDRRSALDGLQGADAAGRRRPADRVRDRQPGRHRAEATGGRPAAAGGGPVGGGPPQERVPGDAGARAAQPAGADQQRRASAARWADGDGEALRSASEMLRASGRPDGAPGRRPARHEPHHARQDRAAQGARRAGADRRAGRRSRPRAVPEHGPRADGHACRRSRCIWTPTRRGWRRWSATC